MNIYLICWQRDCCLSDAVDQQARRLGMPRIAEARFSRWNAHTHQFDFTHIYGFVPVDAENVLATYRAVLWWGLSMESEHDRQQRLIRYLREQVEACRGKSISK